MTLPEIRNAVTAAAERIIWHCNDLALEYGAELRSAEQTAAAAELIGDYGATIAEDAALIERLRNEEQQLLTDTGMSVS